MSLQSYGYKNTKSISYIVCMCLTLLRVESKLQQKLLVMYCALKKQKVKYTHKHIKIYSHKISTNTN